MLLKDVMSYSNIKNESLIVNIFLWGLKTIITNQKRKKNSDQSYCDITCNSFFFFNSNWNIILKSFCNFNLNIFY
jgi:hypothetical protein